VALLLSEDTDTTKPLVELYEKHVGDLEKIFKELGDNPGKALKYPPNDAKEFARKYTAGYYTYIDLKGVMEKAGLEYQEPDLDGPLPPPLPPPDGVRREKLKQSTSTISDDPPGEPSQAEKGSARKKKAPGSDSSLATDSSKATDSSASTEGAAAGNGGHDEHDMRGVSGTALVAQNVSLKKRDPAAPVLPSTNLLPPPPGDDETAPLIALFEDHGGDLVKIFDELGESPRKALKYPPKDALDFATKFIAGKLTDYAAPKPSFDYESRQLHPEMRQTPIQALSAVFPHLPHEVLFASLEAANGSLDGAVNILLESGTGLMDDDDLRDLPGLEPPQPSRPQPSRPPPRQGSTRGAGTSSESAELTDLQRQHIESGVNERHQEDFVLAITVPARSRPNALLKITTTVGVVHARVPPGVQPGQTFFIRMRRGNPFAAPTHTVAANRNEL